MSGAAKSVCPRCGSGFVSEGVYRFDVHGLQYVDDTQKRCIECRHKWELAPILTVSSTEHVHRCESDCGAEYICVARGFCRCACGVTMPSMGDDWEDAAYIAENSPRPPSGKPAVNPAAAPLNTECAE